MENMKKFTVQGKTKLIKGTLLMPEMAGLQLIVVPCSESGTPDGEIYALLDKKWKTVKAELKGWYSHHLDFQLGSIHTTAIQSDIWAVHLLCINKEGVVDEPGLLKGMKKIMELAKSEKASVHMSVSLLETMPNMKALVEQQLLEKGINCYFYEEANKNADK